ncbi:MAG: OmpA family protein [Flavobacterium sp.]|jgi:outer membrane protein OmpA-like peptidoglycan-associated protein|uniref:OmpA family protein n=1 Tax=Flavobacterium TaxID=237 RepID=UPI0022BE08E2|nr:OmpA family protein [Flavobacterium sp.]MCZ8330932.1 OmpA family protein [Flavobacterium sp.]
MKSKIVILFFLISFNCLAQKQFEVFFDFNKDVPNEKSMESLTKLLDENKSIEILSVSGYCDTIDNKTYNKNLAERRINSVLNVIKEKLILISDTVRLDAIGEEFEYSRNQKDNRKVVIKYFESKESKNSETFDLSKLVKLEKDSLASKFEHANKGDVIQLFSIYFNLNTDKIVDESTPVLDELVKIMINNHSLKIEIQGHICCQFVYDLSGLSSIRAKTIYNYLIRHNIDPKRLRHKGFGTLKPIHKIPEENELEEQENRRVEILILNK